MAPVVGYAMILGGTIYLKWKEGQRSDAQLREHFGELAAALAEIEKNHSAATDMLVEIYERRRFVWAKLDGNDKQEIVDRVNEAFRGAGFGGSVSIQDLMGEIRAVRVGVDAIRGEMITKEDLAASEQRIRAWIEENKKSQTEPTQQEWPPELTEWAKVLRERGDKEQRVVAEIALRNHSTADKMIQELKADPVAEAFRLLTLEGDNWYQANEPDKAIQPYDMALNLNPRSFTARNNAILARSFCRHGDIIDRRHQAIALAEETLALLQPKSPDWAATQGNIGNAWQFMPNGDLEDNLNRAINAYQAALEVFTKASHPVDWATTQSNLGTAWARMPTGNLASNLQRAFDAYNAAMSVKTNISHPVDWAGIQNNLGLAWADLPTGDRAENIRKAFEAYSAALTVQSMDSHPTDWAGIQYNMGNAWQLMPTGDRAINLIRAIDAYKSALLIYTSSTHPDKWAGTQANLGTAWAQMPTGSRADNLYRALDLYHDALTVRTKTAHPAGWATIQSNLSNAWAVLAGMSAHDRCDCMRRAIMACKGSLEVYTAHALPRRHSSVANNLAILRKAYESHGCADKVTFDDIPPAE